MEPIEGRVAVVTGAASGIGFGIASALAAAGARVMLADLDPGRLEAKAGELYDAGHDVASTVVDVRDQKSVDALAAATQARFGGVHIVCNNAGIIRRATLSWELSHQDWQDVLDVNLMGVVNGVLTFVPILLASGEPGHIVNTGSLASVLGVPGIGPYTASKHAVLGISEALATEFATIGAPIGVSCLMPGLVRTRIGQEADAPDPEGPLDEGQMDPRDVGPIVVRAIRDNRLFVFTHPESIDGVRARFARITEEEQ
jgi:NAD(P)-dependent dehydrogenase (short-subunit alcohol dehydrogenase family)